MADATYLRARLARIGWTVTEAGCWEWDGARKAKGYGKLGIGGRGGRTLMAHRVSYEAHIGPIPQGLSVLHRCDNPPCVNPSHLFLGTIADNNADMAAKGRAVQGVRQHCAKLTPDAVRKIRSLGDAGMPQREVASRFGIAQSTARDIIIRRSWRSVPELTA